MPRMSPTARVSTVCSLRRFVVGRERSAFQILANDQVEEELPHAIRTALAIDAANIRRLEPDAGHRLEVLAENDRARTERDDEDEQQDDGESDRHRGRKRLDLKEGAQ